MDVCSLCLSCDRRLLCIPQSLHNTFRLLLPDTEMKKLCWECLANLKCADRFRKRALYSKYILKQNNKENIISKSNLTNSSILYSNINDASNGVNVLLSENNDSSNTEQMEIIYSDNIKINEVKLTNVGPLTVCNLENNKAIDNNKEDGNVICDKKNIETNNNNNKGRTKKALKRRNRSQREYKCKECGEVFQSRGKYEYHKQKHRGRVVCRMCTRTFASASALDTHCYNTHYSRGKNKNNEYKYFCQPCGKFFQTSCGYRKHQRTSIKHVDVSKWMYICPDCPKRFPKESLAKQHYETVHLKLNKYKCTECTKQYCSVRSLRAHIRDAHGQNVRLRKFMCEVCGGGFKTLQALKYHLRVHSREPTRKRVVPIQTPQS